MLTEDNIVPVPRRQDVTTIWQALEAWANTLAPWQRKVISLAVDHGRLTHVEIQQVYAELLSPSTPENVSIPDSSGSAEPLSASLRLDRIDGLRGINALPAGAALTFGPGLTVVFGRNGVGKSGFVRVLANACFSRNKPAILPNVHEEDPPEACSAKFHVSLNGEIQPPIAFPQEEEIALLRRITVFDSAVAKQHVSQASAFEFRPRGFDIFVEMARVYGELTKQLDAEIQLKSDPRDFTAAFIGSPTQVSNSIASLNSTTDVAALRTLAVYGDVERARLTLLDAQLTALRAKSPKEILAGLKEAKTDIQTLASRLRDVESEFTSEAARSRSGLASAAGEAAATAALLGSDTFKRPFFTAVGSQEWERFAKAAHALGRKENPAYPSLTDRCLLCERPLDTDSHAHVASLLAFVEGDAQSLAASSQRALDTEISRLKSIQIPDFSAESRVRTHIQRLHPATEAAVAAICASLASSRERAVASLSTRKAVSAVVDLVEALASLNSLIATIDGDVARLESENIEASIASLDLERQTVRHREVLSQLLPQIEMQIANLTWINNANSRRGSLNTRHITEKDKELFARIVAGSYRGRFEKECEELDCRVPVELQTIGRSGQTMRALSIRGGHKPDAILSEGEQKAVALADFLTEVALNPANAGIVLDDPVTSQDFERRRQIAGRLVGEAKRRQVAIFTHDLIFLNQLLVAAEASAVGTVTHWIQRDPDGQPGDVALGDCPDTDKTHRTTQRAKDALAQARTLSGSARATMITKGMGALRTTLEVAVASRLLKETVQRWSEQIRVTALRNVNWDSAKVEDICALYEDLSRYIDAHSHSDEVTGAPPELSDLEEKIAAVDSLISWAKAKRT